MCSAPPLGAKHSSHTTASRRPVVAIVGGGCAGTLTAVNLLHGSGGALDVVLVERSGTFGPGVAYATKDPQHLLNVPAERMSAFCDRRRHFREWADRELGETASGAYLPRASFGAYLESVLVEAERMARPGRRLERVTDEVVDLARTGQQLELELAGGGRIECDRAVLALGNLAPSPPASFPADRRILTNPWQIDGLRDGAAAKRTLVVGMGLTAVDTILSLTAQQPSGEVVAISRSGCFPYAHRPGLHAPAPTPAPPRAMLELTALERHVHDYVESMESRGYDWREAIDGLRPVTPELWRCLSIAGRERFLRERLRAWEVRRHRMAPAVADRIALLEKEGLLRTLAGQVTAVDTSSPELQVSVALRGTDDIDTLSSERIVVCVGPATDVRSASSQLLENLLRRGRATPDALNLGLQTDRCGALLDGVGGGDGQIFALGSLRRGELWESTAVREIRAQARDLARTIQRSLAPAERERRIELAPRC